MLTAGSLNRFVTIQAQGSSQDEYGQPAQTWQDLISCWASIKAVTGKEVYAASGFTSQLTHKITIRYPAFTVRSNMRIAYGQRAFTVQAISDPDEAKVQLDILCLEINEGI